MRKSKAFKGLSLLVLLIFINCNHEENVVRIGVISSLTGTIAPYGKSVLEGIEVAADEINATKGINGRKIELIVEDDKSDSKSAVFAANKLIDVNKIEVIIGPVASSNVMAVAPIVNRRKVVSLSPAAASPNITEAGDYIFRNRAAGALEASELATFAFKKLGLKSACILSINTDYGVGYKEIIKKTYLDFGGNILIDESFDQGSSDFRSQIAKIINEKPEVVFLLANPKEAGTILKQSKELGLKTNFLSNNIESDELIQTAGDSANGLIFVLPAFNPKKEDQIVAKFVRKYKEKFMRTPDLYAANGYDAVYLLKLAIEKVGYSGTEIKNALYQIKDFRGVNGIISFDKNGDVIKPLTFKTIKNGKYVFID